ncbi:hypothetical protein [uncultured Tateyamaria sp.]|uniref:hypothetical protein n=1 Tax=uncultured Tateyamaria sp. TaxID=455651 RepID=UPI00262D9AA1|nr:hypothetical protein [uncultured Tateyamaria sp.]
MDLIAGVSVTLFRNATSVQMHAARFVALGLFAIGASIIYPTIRRSRLRTNGAGAILDIAQTHVAPLILSASVPLIVLALLGPWNAVTRSWRGAPHRRTWYILHWTILIAWLAVALIEPGRTPFSTPSFKDLSPQERQAFITRFEDMRDIHRTAVIAYAIAVFAVFLLPVVLRWLRPRRPATK